MINSPTADSNFVRDKATANPELSEIKLIGKWLWASRIFWVLMALAGGAVLFNTLPQLYPQASQVCTLSVGECTNNSWLQLVTDEANWLDRHNVPREVYAWYTTITVILTSLIMLGLSLLVLRLRANSLIGWLTSLVFLMLGTLGPRQIFLSLSFSFQTSSLPVPVPVVVGVFALVFLLWPVLGLWVFTFPDGRFAPRWSWVLWLYWILQVFWYMLPGELQFLRWPWYLQVLHYTVMIGSPLACQIYRYRRQANLVQQQQIKCLIYTLGLVIAIIVFSVIFPPGPLVLTKPLTSGLVYALFPIGVSVAILRYRLWDIDLIINRTLVFALLTGCVVGLYALIVLGANSLFGFGTTNLAVSLSATGLIAILFQPLRLGLQRTVNRLLFGRRDEPYSVLTGLGQRLETVYQPEAVLPELVNNIANTLKLPFVAIKLVGQERVVSQATTDMAEPTISTLAPTSLPLSYQGETIGALLVSPRRGEERLAGRDLQLLKDLARQIGVVVYNLKLLEDLRQANGELTEANQDLQQARERIITASEEERRRLSRDLHDGVGPTLASLAQRLEITAGMVEKDPKEAVQKIGEIKNQVKTTLGEIRRIVYALRPPALDEYGLIATIVEHAAGLYPLQVQVEAPSELPPLSAAAEVAAYRIILEALTNVQRHAHATRCLVRLTTSSQPSCLILEISDNGRGLPPDYRGGVGLTSLRERTSELGGQYEIKSGQGDQSGTRIVVKLPLPASVPV